MDFVQQIPDWVIWAHYHIAPWGGWLLVALISILGPLWLLRSLYRAVRSVGRRAQSWLGQHRMTQEQLRTQRLMEERAESCDALGLNLAAERQRRSE